MDPEEAKILKKIYGSLCALDLGYYTAGNNPYNELQYAKELITELIPIEDDNDSSAIVSSDVSP